MLTAYDYSMARLFDGAGIEVLLVGDSAANVMAGHETTLPISLQEMLYHARAVVRAVEHALVIVDLPFGSYQEGSTQALRSAVRVMKTTGAHGIKLEGGQEVAPSIEHIVRAGIPVMGHLGLTPQSIHRFGTYATRAEDKNEAARLLEDAQILEKSGCFAIVLEKIPAKLAAQVTKTLKIPTIGIGAGAATDGQVLVSYDMLGITEDFRPRFLRQYANLSTEIKRATSAYIEDVKNNHFPTDNESY